MEVYFRVGISILLPLSFGLGGEYLAHRLAILRRRQKVMRARRRRLGLRGIK